MESDQHAPPPPLSFSSSQQDDPEEGDSSSPLILIHDSEPSPNVQFDLSNDTDEEHDPFDDLQLDVVRRSAIPPLSPTHIFVYLLSPYLKLGAMCIPLTARGLPLQGGIPTLLVAAVASVFVRHVWTMLAKYVHKADADEVTADTFARGRGKEGVRAVLRSVCRLGTAALRVFIAALYLRDILYSLDAVLPRSLRFPQDVSVALVISVFFIWPASLANSLASRRVLYATHASLFAYVFWLGCVWYAYNKEELESRISPVSQLTATAFAFTSSSTLGLYNSFKATTNPHPEAALTKVPRSQTFMVLSMLSGACAAVLMLPLVFFSAKREEGPPVPETETTNGSAGFVLVARSANLLLAIPSLLVTAPPLPFPGRLRNLRPHISKTIYAIAVFVLSLLPGSVIPLVLGGIAIVGALAGTYLLPVVLHIVTYHFNRPLSIVMCDRLPRTWSSVFTRRIPAPPINVEGDPGSTSHDPLLLRKEYLMQRRQLRRRLVWDIGVWLLLALEVLAVVWAVRGRSL